MKSIGLTGGIGSGKSTVARIFEQMGYGIYYADMRSKALYEEDTVVREEVTALLGEGVWNADGSPDRGKIAGIVFQDKRKLQALNGILHPAVKRDYARWLERIEASGYNKGFVLKEAAILYEAGTYTQQDGVIAVYAPKALRLERVATRDGADKQAILDRMRNQWPDARKLQLADFHIFNDGVHVLIPQVMAAVRHFSNS